MNFREGIGDRYTEYPGLMNSYRKVLSTYMNKQVVPCAQEPLYFIFDFSPRKGSSRLACTNKAEV